MKLLIDENVRNKISSILERLNEFPNRQKITLQDVDGLLAHVSQKSLGAISLMNEKASRELSTASFGSLILSITALKLADNQKPRPLKSSWLSPESTFDPNIALECLLVNISNQCFSTINLATHGYAWPARILLRTTLELCWLTIVLISDRQKMLKYCQVLNDNDERILFHQYFSGGKLQKSLIEIEKGLQFSEDVRLLYSNSRSEAYTFFTKHVHNSYPAILAGSRIPSFDDPEVLEYALFSNASTVAKGVVASLNQNILFYLIGTLLPILKIVHSFDSAKSWDDIVTLRECFVRLYVSQNSSI